MTKGERLPRFSPAQPKVAWTVTRFGSDGMQLAAEQYIAGMGGARKQLLGGQLVEGETADHANANAEGRVGGGSRGGRHLSQRRGTPSTTSAVQRPQQQHVKHGHGGSLSSATGSDARSALGSVGGGNSSNLRGDGDGSGSRRRQQKHAQEHRQRDMTGKDDPRRRSSLDGSNRDSRGVGDSMAKRQEQQQPRQGQLRKQEGRDVTTTDESADVGKGESRGVKQVIGAPPPSPGLMSNDASACTPGTGTPRFAKGAAGYGGRGGAGGPGRGQWGWERLPSKASAMRRMESSGSCARSERRKNKGMDPQNGPLSSVRRGSRGSHFWAGPATSAAAVTTPMSAGSSVPNSGGSILGAETPSRGVGVNRGFNGGFWDSLSAAGSFCSGQFPQALWGGGFDSTKYRSMINGGGNFVSTIQGPALNECSSVFSSNSVVNGGSNSAFASQGPALDECSNSFTSSCNSVGDVGGRGGDGGLGGDSMAAPRAAAQAPPAAVTSDSVTPAVHQGNSSNIRDVTSARRPHSEKDAAGTVDGEDRDFKDPDGVHDSGGVPSVPLFPTPTPTLWPGMPPAISSAKLQSRKSGGRPPPTPAKDGDGVRLSSSTNRSRSNAARSSPATRARRRSADGGGAGAAERGMVPRTASRASSKGTRRRRCARARSGSNGGEAVPEAAGGRNALGEGTGPTRAHVVKRSYQQERARAWEAEAERRSALPARLEALAMQQSLEAPTELRKAWMWDDRPGVAKMLNEVADSMAAAGFRDEAADFFDRCIGIYVAYAKPKGHGVIAEALHDLGYVLWDACVNPVFVGQDAAEDMACTLIANAEGVFQLALSECRSCPGMGHPLAATCLSTLSDCASARSSYEEATYLCQLALRVCEECFGPKHVDTADTLRKLGGLLHRQGLLEEALLSYSRAHDIFKDVLGEDHEDVGSALNLMAVVVGEQGHYLPAENYHRRALDQRRRAGADGPDDLAPFCYNLALVVGTNARKGPREKMDQGHQEAEALLREALAIYERTLPRDHPEIADCTDKLAAAVAMNGDIMGAEILHREALASMERTLPPDDPRIAEVIFNLAAVIGGQKGRLGETENILRRCLEAQKRLNSSDHPDVVIISAKLDDVIRTRDAASTCRGSSDSSSHISGIVGGKQRGSGSTAANAHAADAAAHRAHDPADAQHALTASCRNGMSLASWWDSDSVTSGGSSSLFGSACNSRSSFGSGGGGGFRSGGSNWMLNSRSDGLAGIGKDGVIPEEDCGQRPPEAEGPGQGISGTGETEADASGGCGDGAGAASLLREMTDMSTWTHRVRSGELAGVGKDGAAMKKDSGQRAPESKGPRESLFVRGEEGAGANGGKAGGGDGPAVANPPRKVTDNGMQGGIRIGARFASALSMPRSNGGGGGGGNGGNSAGNGSNGRGNLALFFDAYSRGKSRHGRSDSSSSICSLEADTEDGASDSRRPNTNTKATPARTARKSSQRGSSLAERGGRSSRSHSSGRLGRKGSGVKAGTGRAGNGRGGDGGGSKSAKGPLASRPSGGSVSSSSTRKSGGAERQPRRRPVSYPVTTSSRVVSSANASFVGGSGSVPSRSSIGRGGSGGSRSGGSGKMASSVGKIWSCRSPSEDDESTLSSLDDSSGLDSRSSAGHGCATSSSSLSTCSPLSTRSTSSSGGGSDTDGDAASVVGDVASLHGDEDAAPRVSHRRKGRDAFATNSDHSDIGGNPNVWSDGVFESSGNSTHGAAGRCAVASFMQQRQAGATSAAVAAELAATFAPSEHASLGLPGVSTARPVSGVEANDDNRTGGAPTQLQAPSDGKIHKAAGGSLGRRVKAFGSAILGRGSSQKSTPEGGSSWRPRWRVAGRQQTGTANGGDARGTTLDTTKASTAPGKVSSTMFPVSYSRRGARQHVELQIPAMVSEHEREDEETKGRFVGKDNENDGADDRTPATELAPVGSEGFGGAVAPWAANMGGRQLTDDASSSDEDEDEDDVALRSDEDSAAIAHPEGDRTVGVKGRIVGGASVAGGSSSAEGTTSVAGTVSDMIFWAHEGEDDRDTTDGGSDGSARRSAGVKKRPGVPSALVTAASAAATAFSKVTSGKLRGSSCSPEGSEKSGAEGGGGDQKPRILSRNPGSDCLPPGMKELQAKAVERKRLGNDANGGGNGTTKNTPMRQALQVSEKAATYNDLRPEARDNVRGAFP